MANTLAELFRQYEEVPVSNGVEAVAAELPGQELLLPLVEPPGDDGTIAMLVAQDGAGQSWAYLYADVETLAGAVEQGTSYVHITFDELFAMVNGNPAFGGIGIFAGEQSYLLPAEYFERVDRVISGGDR